ncbi:MAG TPA: hypothetical protein VMW80_09005 [Candidatus Dormibacteraeota bacterium]|nr:hypothetical protein [Candidatus Dormibacteraeota bacterium]
MTVIEPEHKRQRDRSPSYPGISLEVALARARTFYEKEGRHEAPTTVALRHWGFSTRTGSANVTLAAPAKYGLMEASGKGDGRKVRLTELGLRLLRDGNPDREGDLVTAALTPSVFAELWAHCQREGGMPSDDNLRWWLQQRNFTDGAVREFVRTFKETLRYAGLLAGDKIGPTDEEPHEAENRFGRGPIPGGPFDLFTMTPPAAAVEQQREASPQQPHLLQFPIPLADSDLLAALQLPSRMTEADWNRMLAIIGAYKTSIVRALKQTDPEA